MIVFLKDALWMDLKKKELGRILAVRAARLKWGAVKPEIDTFILYADEVRQSENTPLTSASDMQTRLCKKKTVPLNVFRKCFTVLLMAEINITLICDMINSKYKYKLSEMRNQSEMLFIIFFLTHVILTFSLTWKNLNQVIWKSETSSLSSKDGKRRPLPLLNLFA